MNVVGISGSPRRNGNTACLIKKSLEEIETHGIETELISLSEYNITDCRGCERCKDSYSCVIKDDMQKIYPKLVSADAIVVGSPTYFYGMTAIMFIS